MARRGRGFQDKLSETPTYGYCAELTNNLNYNLLSVG